MNTCATGTPNQEIEINSTPQPLPRPFAPSRSSHTFKHQVIYFLSPSLQGHPTPSLTFNYSQHSFQSSQFYRAVFPRGSGNDSLSPVPAGLALGCYKLQVFSLPSAPHPPTSSSHIFSNHPVSNVPSVCC